MPQNGSYDLNDIDRERINGQAVLQFRPVDGLMAARAVVFGQASARAR